MTTAPLDQLRTALADRYRLERELGQGGMATVYLAHDLRHERKVAIKVLRPELAAVIGAERFVREIRTIAALQHPHILGLIDSGEVQGTAYYVMPFVEGESLRGRLVREKQLPVGDAIRIASEVASALDYAHRHGVIHRDIKPENILLHDGQALVADFGIALAVSQAGGSRMTETGMSLGTPFYMSPEQAMGEREITARSDVYALGAVLYELLTGDPPFTGSTAQAIVARVVTESPRPLVPQRHTIPAHVEAAVLTALEKLPADRFATAAQFADALERPSAATMATLSATARVPLARSARKGQLAGLAPWAIGALAGLAVGAMLVTSLRRAPDAPRRTVVRFGIQLPRDAQPVGARGSIIAFSPDGSQIVYIGKSPSAQQRLYSRRLDQPDPVPIPGTDGANLPFFSPDGQWLGFQQGTKLVKVALAGGPISTITPVSGQVAGAAWAPGDTIVFGGDSGLMDVPASGGVPRVIARADTGETFTFPDVLPNGRAVLFGIAGHGALKLAVLDRRTNTVKRLRQDGGYPRYVNGGFVVLNDRTGITSAVPFDADRLEVTGAARALAEKLGASGDGDRNIGVSRTGDFAYQVSTRQGLRLLRVGRAGGVLDLGVDSAFYALPAVSPDGRRVALTRSAEDGFDHRDVWVFDLAQQTESRVTFDTLAAWSAWTPDGRQIAYMKVAGTPPVTTLMIVPADGSAAPRAVLTQPGFWRPAAFEPGGRTLVYHGSSGQPQAKESIWRIGVDSGATPQQILASPFDYSAPSLSPDGRWLTYTTTESGRSEVYVRSYPQPGGRWQVSLGGGTEPVWSPVGNEIFYRVGDVMMAAAVRTQPSFEVTGRTKVFTGEYDVPNPADQDYAVAPDGKSFFMLQVVTTSQQAIVVTLNLFDQVRAGRKQ